MLNQLISDLQKHSDIKEAELCKRFCKTEKGQYGEGYVFIGVKMSDQRRISKKYVGISLPRIQMLLNSNIQEYKMSAGIILVYKYKKAKGRDKEEIFNFYIKNTKKFNNWGVVDVTCPWIVGDFLLNHQEHKKILYKLVQSDNLWEKRISIVSTYTFIKNNQFEDILAISELLLKDKHDLIHKAVGWMLREVGKKDKRVLDKFLKQHYKDIPRTALRYAIEKHPEDERKKLLKGELK